MVAERQACNPTEAAAQTVLGAQPHGFEGQCLVVVVPQLYGLAVTKRRN